MVCRGISAMEIGSPWPRENTPDRIYPALPAAAALALGNDMELKQLKYFLCVAELGSFSKAAIKLAVAQPNLSRQIRTLEEEFKTPLFHRNGRGTVLSEAGKRLQDHARGILASVEEAGIEISAMRASPGGPIAIAMPPSIGWVLTVPLIRRCRQEFPDIALHVVDAFSGHVMEWLSNGTIDIGVVYNAPRHTSLPCEPLLEEDLVLLGPTSDPEDVGFGPVEAARLAGLPLILPARPHGLRVLVDRTLAAMGLTPRIELELDAMTSTLTLVEDGFGYTVLCAAAVRHLLDAGRIRAWPMTAPGITRQLMLATSTQRPSNAAARMIIKLIRQQVASLYAAPSAAGTAPGARHAVSRQADISISMLALPAKTAR
jgi:LysR family nitrogen assimilation transcriptional regulator